MRLCDFFVLSLLPDTPTQQVRLSRPPASTVCALVNASQRHTHTHTHTHTHRLRPLTLLVRSPFSYALSELLPHLVLLYLSLPYSLPRISRRSPTRTI